MDERVGKFLRQEGRPVRSIFIYLFGTLLLALISGCAELEIRTGRMPNIAAQEQFLKLGQSTRAEVETLLGKPYGKGTYTYLDGTKNLGKWEVTQENFLWKINIKIPLTGFP